VTEDHRHCKVCGKPVAAGKDTCSQVCRDKRAAVGRTKQMYTYILYGMIALLLILLVVRL
jgi:predicted nucleic acid-binding Zn ribbon protein